MCFASKIYGKIYLINYAAFILSSTGTYIYMKEVLLLLILTMISIVRLAFEVGNFKYICTTFTGSYIVMCMHEEAQ